ncbi:MAG: phosphoribosylglycinamide formyltransferase [Planctomycetes bacterium]|nr:phosphoribosylglycinamide formyltransferase [Planctomycetota bacterium]
MFHDPIRFAVLISGGGTTLQNLIDRIADGRMMAEIVFVISSNPAAGGIERALRAGLPVEVIRREDHPSVASFSDAIFGRCRAVSADLVTLAGFLKLIKIPPDFAGRVINIHPALLPAFGGKGMYGHRVHEAVLKAGVKVSGCTVHLVDDQYDHGPIILQRTIPVRAGDTPETLAARVFEQECEAYPEAIRLFATGQLATVRSLTENTPTA